MYLHDLFAPHGWRRLGRPEEGVEAPGTGVTVSDKPPCGCQELSLIVQPNKQTDPDSTIHPLAFSPCFLLPEDVMQRESELPSTLFLKQRSQQSLVACN